MSAAQQYVLIFGLIAACLTFGALVAVFADRLVAYRLKNLSARFPRLSEQRLKIVSAVFSLIFRVLGLAVVTLSAYLLSKMPLVYHCAFK